MSLPSKNGPVLFNFLERWRLLVLLEVFQIQNGLGTFAFTSRRYWGPHRARRCGGTGCQHPCWGLALERCCPWLIPANSLTGLLRMSCALVGFSVIRMFYLFSSWFVSEGHDNSKSHRLWSYVLVASWLWGGKVGRSPDALECTEILW